MTDRFLKSYCLTAFLLIVFALSANAASPDSLRTRWVNGQKVLLHKVQPKETWTGVSRKYGMDISTLQKANPGVKDLKIGQIINVPLLEDAGREKPVQSPAEVPVQTQEPAREKTSSANENSPKNLSAQTHVVQKGETLFRISGKYGLSVAELKSLNGLTDNNVKVGQRLVVSKATIRETAESTTDNRVGNDKKDNKEDKEDKIIIKPQVEVKEKVSTTSQSTSPAQPKNQANPQPSAPVAKPAPDELPKAYSNPGASRNVTIEKDEKTGAEIERFEENGVIAWFNDPELNQKKFYALHRTAPIGTIIKVTNRMNNNSVYVKVVGVLPDTGDNENIICKITQAAAQRIGALDQRFTASLSYGITRK